MIFVFTNGIEEKLADVLKNVGVVVKGQLLLNDTSPVDVPSESKKCDESPVSELSTKCTSDICKVNLDVSAMLAYVSSVTNGSCDKYEFSVPVLSQQAKWECLRPQKPILDDFFKGLNSVFCQ